MEERLSRVKHTCPDCESKCARAIIQNRIILYCPDCGWDEELDGYQQRPQPLYVTLAEAADFFHVKHTTIQRMIRDSILPAKKTTRDKHIVYLIPEWALERAYLNGYGNDVCRVKLS